MVDEKWQQILDKCELPSTKMLLSQQAKLSCITPEEVVITLSPNWQNMIKSRAEVIEKAVKKVFGEKMSTTFVVRGE